MSNETPFPRIGIHYGATDISMPVLDLAHAAAERGFESLVLPEHTHIPVSRSTPYPTGEEMPDRYRRLLDPYIALSFVAAQTGLAVGTCISLVAQHDPVALAKATATLDLLCGGRFFLGVGYGWNKEELADHGVSFKDRRAVVREHVGLMRSLWQDTEAEFHGKHSTLERSWAWPKPVQQPSIPVLLGTSPSERAFGEVVEWADGWIPGGYDVVDILPGALASLRRRWFDEGRPEPGPLIYAMQGEIGRKELRRRLECFHSLGVARVFLDLPSEPRDHVLPILDSYADVLRNVPYAQLSG